MAAGGAWFQCGGCGIDIVVPRPVPTSGTYKCIDPDCDAGIDFAHAFRACPEAWDLDEGYAAYCRGEKQPSDASHEFREGWWAAADAHERFGEHDSFIAAPDGER